LPAGVTRPNFPYMVSSAWVRAFGTLAMLSCFATGCNGSSSDDDDDGMGGGSNEFEWVCFEGDISCWCTEVGPGRNVDSSEPEVLACSSFTCCLYAADAQRGGECECENLATDCQAEASSRPGTVVVPTCPVGEVDLSRCAASGVNCREDFLEQEHLLGCCPGLTCQMNAEGVPVCL